MPDEATIGRGLTRSEADKRHRQYGDNIFRDQPQRAWILQYLSRFKNPLVLILLSASVISAFTGELTNFLIISTMVLLSVTLDFVQEYRANAAAEKLRLSVALRITVLRDGAEIDIPIQQIVPGDIALLCAGDLIPADGIIFQAHDFFVKQSLLTGEPYPVEKSSTIPARSATELVDATNAVFMGTSVISGSARMLVVHTGVRTSIGEIADSISRASDPTPFETGTRRFGMLIMRLTFLMVMFVLLVNALFHKPWLESFLFAVALAVGLTPELLPMIISVTLSRGAIRMARQHMIVKRQTAIQDLGSMDVLCTDKTGTLTQAIICLDRHVNVQGQSSERVLELAYLNSYFESGVKSPLDQAILAHATLDVSNWTKIDEVPFDFERRRVSVLVSQADTRSLIVKGAPDDILQLCTQYEPEDASGHLALDEQARSRMYEACRSLEEKGLRVLGIAWRPTASEQTHAVINDETELVFAGFVAFLDPPKESAGIALASLGKLGVTIKIVTGDSDLVTRHVCTQLNIPVLGVLTGKEMMQMDDRALQAVVEANNLFCRVNPAQKERVIRALRARGHVVGYLGDGINDAPSLHAADIGLSVDSAVDVAKEAADMILLKQDLRVLHAGVVEGRRTFGNIMKYIMMGTSSNFGNMFSMAGGALFLPFLPMLPTQILLNNILYDISEIPIPLDKVDEQEVLQPRTLDLNFIRNFMLVIGPISSLFDFLTFYVMLVVLKADEKLFQTGWFVESLCTQVLVIFIIRTRGNPLKSRPHPLLTVTSLLVVLIAILLPFTSVGRYFGFVPPPMDFYLILAAMVMVYLVLVQIVKQVFYKWYEGRQTSRSRRVVHA